MSDTVLVGIVGVAGTLLGVALSSGIQVFISRQAYQQETERDTVAYRRQVADAKRDRLIRRYEEASRAAEMYFALSRRILTSVKEEGISLIVEGQRAYDALQEVKAYLALEDGTDDVIKLCDKLQMDYGMLRLDAELGDLQNQSFDKTLIAMREALRAHLKAV